MIKWSDFISQSLLYDKICRVR